MGELTIKINTAIHGLKIIFNVSCNIFYTEFKKKKHLV